MFNFAQWFPIAPIGLKITFFLKHIIYQIFVRGFRNNPNLNLYFFFSSQKNQLFGGHFLNLHWNKTCSIKLPLTLCNGHLGIFFLHFMICFAILHLPMRWKTCALHINGGKLLFFFFLIFPLLLVLRRPFHVHIGNNNRWQFCS